MLCEPIKVKTDDFIDLTPDTVELSKPVIEKDGSEIKATVNQPFGVVEDQTVAASIAAAELDPDLKPENVRKDVELFGVVGEYAPNLEAKNVKYEENGAFNVVPEAPVEGFSSVKVNVDLPIQDEKTYKVKKEDVNKPIELTPDVLADGRQATSMKKATITVDVDAAKSITLNKDCVSKDGSIKISVNPIGVGQGEVSIAGKVEENTQINALRPVGNTDAIYKVPVATPDGSLGFDNPTIAVPTQEITKITQSGFIPLQQGKAGFISKNSEGQLGIDVDVLGLLERAIAGTDMSNENGVIQFTESGFYKNDVISGYAFKELTLSGMKYVLKEDQYGIRAIRCEKTKNLILPTYTTDSSSNCRLKIIGERTGKLTLPVYDGCPEKTKKAVGYDPNSYEVDRQMIYEVGHIHENGSIVVSDNLGQNVPQRDCLKVIAPQMQIVSDSMFKNAHIYEDNLPEFKKDAPIILCNDAFGGAAFNGHSLRRLIEGNKIIGLGQGVFAGGRHDYGAFEATLFLDYLSYAQASPFRDLDIRRIIIPKCNTPFVAMDIPKLQLIDWGTDLTGVDVAPIGDNYNYNLMDCNLGALVIRKSDTVVPLNGGFYRAPSIYVPDTLVDEYKAATNWSKYASSFNPLSTLPEQYDYTKHPEWRTWA